MKALSIRQPWAHIVVHEGKGLENRGWPTDFRGPFLIHASKTMTLKWYDDAVWFLRDQVEGGMSIVERLPHPKELQRGGIIGIGRITGCVPSPKRWEDCARFELPDGYVLVLDDVHPLRFVPCSGALGLWEVPAHVVERTGLGALRTYAEGWRPQPVTYTEGSEPLPGMFEVREAPPEASHGCIFESRLSAFGLQVRDALGGHCA